MTKKKSENIWQQLRDWAGIWEGLQETIRGNFMVLEDVIGQGWQENEEMLLGGNVQ